jgi:hypothetical protein
MKIQKGSISVEISVDELAEMLDNNQAGDLITMILDLSEADQEIAKNPFFTSFDGEGEQIGYQVIEIDASEMGGMNDFIDQLLNMEGFEVIDFDGNSSFGESPLSKIFGPEGHISEDEHTIIRIIDHFGDI